jgi:hypothetical protein
MAKQNLKQLEQVKSRQKHLEDLSPEKQRAAIIRMRNAQAKNSQKSVIFLAVLGLLISAVAIYFWFVKYELSLPSTLGVLTGIVIAVSGFQYLQANKVTSYAKIQSNEFTDEDITAYFREHEQVNKKALEQWNKRGKYVVFIGVGLLVLLLNYRPTASFAFMVLATGLSVFFIGLFLIWLVEKYQWRTDRS